MDEQLHFHTALPDTPKAPEWVHLLPSGRFHGVDGRGPYETVDTEALIRHSMSAEGGKLPIDENHATDHALTHGGSAPAVAWIDRMEARGDGIWGHVQWTNKGRNLVEDHAYRGISPAFAASDGKVTRIARASLTNLPNLKLNLLHNREPRMELSELRRRLSLAETATQADIEAALDRAGSALSLHAQIVPLAGLTGSPSNEAIVTGLQARAQGIETHAQQQISALKGEVKTLQADAARVKAEHALHTAAAEGRVISEPMHKRLVDLHMQDPQAAQEIIEGLPKVGGKVELHHRKPGRKSGADDDMVKSAASTWGQDPAKLRAMMGGDV